MDLSRVQQAIVAVALAGILVGAGMLFYARQRTAAPVPADEFFTETPEGPQQPSAAPGPLRVHVAGAVARPGPVQVPAGATVQDVLYQAGGALRTADLGALDLTQTVQDGASVYVPALGPLPNESRVSEPPPLSRPAPRTATAAVPTAGPHLVNINTADSTELQKLPGIGPVLAGSIIADRQKNGPFLRLDDLSRVRGIGSKKLIELRPYVTVR